MPHCTRLSESVILTVYTDQLTPRVEYIFSFVLQDIIGLDIRLTSELGVASAADYCLNYSTSAIKGAVQVTPHGLLSRTMDSSAVHVTIDDQGRFFKTDSDLLGFDLFAASFYLLSRMEEYTATEQDFDLHGRYVSSASLIGKAGLLDQPLIDQWAYAAKDILREKYPLLTPGNRDYHYLCTFDIDVAYAYGGRGRLRSAASMLKDISRLDMERLRERRSVSRGELNDPYDTYAYQAEIIERYGSDARYFFLVGDREPDDRNLDVRSRPMTDLITRLSEQHTIGVHPSIGSHRSPRQLKKEIDRLAEVSGSEITHSRQHFLKWRLPETYSALESQGITSDYSMGYADTVGFRASTCTPHLWYDLARERESALRVYPLTVMDSTLKDYLKLTPQEAIARLSGLVDRVRQVDGLFVSLWHNHSINDLGEWKGWRAVFEHTLKAASQP